MRKLLVVLTAAALVMAGCSSVDVGADNSQRGSALEVTDPGQSPSRDQAERDGDKESGSEQADEGVARSQKTIDKYMGLPAFVAPGGSFDARAAAGGKKIMLIPVSSEIPVTSFVSASMSEGAKAVGLELQVWENSGQQSQWVAGIEHAINENFDVIDLLAIPPELVRPQLERARENGIKIDLTHFSGFTHWEKPNYVDASVRLPYYEVGVLEAAQANVDTNGEANALIIIADDLASTQAVVDGIKDEFRDNCGEGCTYEIVNVPTTDWAERIPDIVRSNMQRDPSINYIIPIYDAMVSPTIAGLNAAGASDIGIVSFNGTPDVLAQVASGEVSALIGESEPWIGLAMLDQDMRLSAGMDPIEDSYKDAPLRMFTSENIDEVGTPPDATKGYGEYLPHFLELWQVS